MNTLLQVHALNKQQIQASAIRMAQALTQEQTIQQAIDLLTAARVPFTLIAIEHQTPRCVTTMGKGGHELCIEILNRSNPTDSPNTLHDTSPESETLSKKSTSAT